MIRIGRSSRLFVVLIALGSLWVGGCDRQATTPTGPDRIEGPVTIHPGSGDSRTFEAGAEIPPASFSFEGAPGYVRVTIEAEQSSGSGLAASSLNDALFQAKGRGRIVVSFRKPWPGHDEGRLTVRCEGGSEDSSAEFEPSLWFRDPTAVVAFDAPTSGSLGPAEAGREVVLARYAAKVGAKAVGLTLKATFGAEPLPVRVQAKVGGR